MIELVERAGIALSRNISEEERIVGKVWRFSLMPDARIEVEKALPVASDVLLEFEGYPVLAVPEEIVRLDESLVVDITPTANGAAIALVVRAKEGG